MEELWNESKYFELLLFRTSVAVPDPGSGAFLTPGPESGHRFGISFSRFRISDPGSPTHISESLVTIFWVKKTLILSKLATFFVPVQK